MCATSCEIIRQNLEFVSPERFGMCFDTDGRVDDFFWAQIALSQTWQPRKWIEGNTEYYDDEWGNIWHRKVGMSEGGEILKPVLKNWSELDDYCLPDMANPGRFEQVKHQFSVHKQKYAIGMIPGFPFAVCRKLRKMDVYLEDLVLERKYVDELHSRISLLLEQILIQFADAGADGIFFCEDWGIQDRLLINPSMWREIFKPLYQKLCNTAHELGLHVLMHSCGYNWEILDDLAEVGINAFQFDQISLYGLERLAKKLRHLKVCLFSPVDIQTVLPSGNRKIIEAEAGKMVELFSGEQGGFIAKNYTDLKGIGVKPEWDQWAYDIFLALSSKAC